MISILVPCAFVLITLLANMVAPITAALHVTEIPAKYAVICGQIVFTRFRLVSPKVVKYILSTFYSFIFQFFVKMYPSTKTHTFYNLVSINLVERSFTNTI